VCADNDPMPQEATASSNERSLRVHERFVVS